MDAVVFDFDGLIVDSETADYESWRRVFAAVGARLAREEWIRHIGGSAHGFDPYAELARATGQPVVRDDARRRRRAEFRALMDGRGPLPGVLNWLEDARELGMAVGLASSSGSDWVRPELARLDLLDVFDAVATRDDVEQVKPDPALYQKVIQELGAAPERSLALEDSRNGLLAAKAAGLTCIVVPNAMTRELDFSEADLVMRDLTELTLREALARFRV